GVWGGAVRAPPGPLVACGGAVRVVGRADRALLLLLLLRTHTSCGDSAVGLCGPGTRKRLAGS
ncbi:hypothetical protein ABT255_51695, partial [Streptomyces mirabilis]|uniref:hypothetical protein n=1 Tax=Streptomyces mirabilis TaxID=68239 RepID=UPI003321BF22